MAVLKARLEIERALLAGLMGPTTLRSRMSAQHLDLKPTEFYRAGYGKLFDLLRTIEGQGLPPVEPVVLARAKELGLFEEVEGIDAATIVALCAEPAPADPGHLARMVRESSIARGVTRDLRSLQEVIDGGNLTEAREMLLRIADSVTLGERTGARDAPTVVDAAIAKANERRASYDGQGALGGSQLPSGLLDLDKLVRVERGQFVVLGGRPGMGKSAIALGMALANSTDDRGALYVSLEMQEWELAFRSLGLLESVDVSSLIKGSIGSKWPDVEQGFAALRARRLWIDDRVGLTIESVWSEGRRVKSLYPTTTLLVVDHIGLLRASSKHHQREVEKLSHITAACKAMAKDLDLCVLGLAQLSRAVEQRDLKDRRPRMSDFRDSGTIEQDADILLGAFREGYYNAHFDQGAGEILNLKQRNNESHAVAKVRWDGPSICYRDAPQWMPK